jgi:DNA-binding MarR family transcriptional regulator
LTVPDIARQKNVTRQHIQQIVNELCTMGLAESLANPAHKRSLLIRLSPGGGQQFRNILEREQLLLQTLSAEFDDQQLTQAADSLHAIRKYFSSVAWHTRLQTLIKK